MAEQDLTSKDTSSESDERGDQRLSLENVQSSVVGLRINNNGDTNFALQNIHSNVAGSFIAHAESNVMVGGSVNFKQEDHYHISDQTDEREKIVMWLEKKSMLNFQSKRDDIWAAQDKCFKNRDDIRAHPEFRSWKEDGNGILWCYGAPGSGKSTFVTSIIRSLEHWTLEKKQHYFGHRGLAGHENRESFNAEFLMTIIVEEISLFGEVYLIFDGIEQCPNETLDSDRKTFIRWINGISKHAKVLVSSWDKPEIREGLDFSQEIRISPTEEDLMMYAMTQIQKICGPSSDPASSHSSGPLELDRFSRDIAKNSKGSFLLARMQIAATLISDTEQEDFRLPQDLFEFYNDYGMERILTQQEKYISQAMQILGWICFAARPLMADELFDLLSMSFENEKAARDILTNRCGGLVILSEDGTVSLFHQTLRSFLLGSEVKGGGLHRRSVHEAIGLTSIRHLQRSAAQSTIEAMKGPGFQYAADFWGYHIRHTRSPSARKEAQLFLQDREKIRLAAHHMSNFQISSETDISGLHLAAYFGSRWLALDFIESNISQINHSTRYGTTALHIAVKLRHDRIVEALLQHGADPNKADIKKKTPLHWAIESDELNAAAILITKAEDIDISPQDSELFTPLRRAAKNGSTKAVRLLLDWRGDIIDEQDSSGFTPLREAVTWGQQDVVDLLISRGARLEPNDKFRWSFLCFAVRHGYVGLTRRLITRGVDLNQVDEQHRKTALHLAFEHEHSMIAWHLMEAGANPNAKDDAGFTILHNFVLNWNERKNKSLFWLLLNGQSGTDLNTQDNNKNWTALHYAAAEGNSEVIWLLAATSPSRNRTNHQGRLRLDSKDLNGDIPLQIAMNNRQWLAAEILMQHGADVHSRDQGNSNMLHAAVLKAPLSTLSLLLDKGADMSRYDTQGLSPLHLAVQKKNVHAVEILCRKRPNELEMHNSMGFSALQMAAMDGSSEVVAVLLRSKSDCHRRSRCGLNSLQLSVKSKKLEVVIQLTDHGARVDESDDKGNTSLHYAAISGDDHIILELRKKKGSTNAINREGETPLHIVKKLKRSTTAWLCPI
ncbi:hypothetical protein E8E14_014692 [Neopestalotiopsis sp. 37M]|nr:hypothetical protein E8E14_014692 [Neopestalotiopsis sp. 37M]